MIQVRRAILREIPRIVAVSNVISEDLKAKGYEDYFEGIDTDEVKAAMEENSVTFVAEDENEAIIGFILVMKKGNLYYLTAYGVKPEYRNEGIASQLLMAARAFAIANGVRRLNGMVHPDDIVSRKTLQEAGKSYWEDKEFICQSKEGRNLRRIPFVLQLV